ncbi:MAG: hypothetical protein GC201_10840 [Alphaproteobacteria bacterium]|nr:hypothetical protein [Alphaproteobacteria bacterium]
MSGRRHTRNAALLIGAFGGLGALWLVASLLRAGVHSGWWLELAFYALLAVTALFLGRGSDLARFGAVLIFGAALLSGTGPLIDATAAGRWPAWTLLVRDVALLASGAYGLWVLLLSDAVREDWRRSHGDGPYALPIAILILAATVLGIAWYVDGLSTAVLRTLGAQLAIALAFVALIGFMAARKAPGVLRWEYVPLALAAVVAVANLDSITQLRSLRPVAHALARTPDDLRPAFAAHLDGEAGRITRSLADIKDATISQLDSEMRAINPIPLLTVLDPGRVVEPREIADTAEALHKSDGLAGSALSRVDNALETFHQRRLRAVADLPAPVRDRLETIFTREREAYRSHYAARIHLLMQARGRLSTMLQVLSHEQGHYTVDWRGAAVFENPKAAAEFDDARSSSQELALWDSRLRTEGVELQARYPAWQWLHAVLRPGE